MLASLAKVVEERSAELSETKKKLAEKDKEAASRTKEIEELRSQVCAAQPHQSSLSLDANSGAFA